MIRTNEHLDNLLPGGESLDENVGRLELMGGGVLLDLHVSCLIQLSPSPPSTATACARIRT